jgi:hypothetical protein
MKREAGERDITRKSGAAPATVSESTANQTPLCHAREGDSPESNDSLASPETGLRQYQERVAAGNVRAGSRQVQSRLVFPPLHA